MVGRVALVPRDIAAHETTLLPSEVRRALTLSLVEGMLAQVHITLTAGAFLTGLALMLGAGNLTLGLITALPFLIQPLQLLGAWLIERQGQRKPLTVLGSLGRAVWLVVIVLPYLPFGATQRLALLVTALSISHALLTICANAWTNWMTDLVPPRLRGRYFGTRNTVLAAVAMLVNYLGGAWLDRMRAAGDLAHGYALMLGLAVLCGACSTLLLARQPEPPMARLPRLPLREVVCLPFRHPAFRRFMAVLVLWNLALGTSAPFFGAHALTVLGVSFATLAMFDVITSAVSLLTLPWWGRLSDRIGHRRVLLICMALVVLLPWSWILATPDTLWILFLNAMLAGIGWPGVGLAQGNRLLERAPATARSAYLAIFAAATGLAFFVASTGAGALADLLAGVQWHLGPLTLNEYQITFLLSSLLRGSAVVLGRRWL